MVFFKKAFWQEVRALWLKDFFVPLLFLAAILSISSELIHHEPLHWLDLVFLVLSGYLVTTDLLAAAKAAHSKEGRIPLQR